MIALTFPPEINTVRAARMNEVYAIIAKAAEHSLPCPSNDTLARRLDLKSVSGPVYLIKLLEDLGHIEVRRTRKSRVIKIKATGRCTAEDQSARGGEAWTAEEKIFVQEKMDVWTPEQIARALPNGGARGRPRTRTARAVENMIAEIRTRQSADGYAPPPTLSRAVKAEIGKHNARTHFIPREGSNAAYNPLKGAGRIDAKTARAKPPRHFGPVKACLWPMWNETTPRAERMFCEAAPAQGKPYCPEHCARAYRRRVKQDDGTTREEAVSAADFKAGAA